ncbi:Coatomer subunit delta [Fasciola gigantica]|uniref:Coatomer subunit delta n=1 Tax=Fasciola gigantica TaxID=46835 RepID=A0A504YHV7_FASGI|nr:Coatomer subunit delta [Fasciola gigantica]
MTKARIEGLIATFPKLLGEGKQHTFVETESVRYVYQPLEQLYVLLITTKASNILEDLETLRLFARVIPEYACGTDEADVLNNAFQLIFAFDEIVALGYREDVNISQIRTFTEMDSHEERVFRAVQESKEREAKDFMKQRARDLQLARQEAAKRGAGSSVGSGARSFRASMSGFGSDTPKSDEPRVVVTNDRFGEGSFDGASYATSASSGIPTVKRSGMKLGGGGLGGAAGGIEQFVDQLKAEGEAVHDDVARLLDSTSDLTVQSGDHLKRIVGSSKPQTVHKEDLHIRIEEKMMVQASRDGGLEQFEVQGIMYALANTAATNEARLRIDTNEALNPRNEKQPPTQLQTHPNLDKKAFVQTNWLQVKPGGKPFPVGQEVGVLRWRLQTQDESVLPISVNCWPNEIRGGFEVNIEYELQNTDIELHDVVVNIPLPSSSKPPVVGNCDGDYELVARKTQLEWRLPIIDADSPSGSIEFTISTDRGSKADDFFPLKLSLISEKSFCGIRVMEAVDPKNKPVTFSTETRLYAEKFEIV